MKFVLSKWVLLCALIGWFFGTSLMAGSESTFNSFGAIANAIDSRAPRQMDLNSFGSFLTKLGATPVTELADLKPFDVIVFSDSNRATLVLDASLHNRSSAANLRGYQLPSAEPKPHAEIVEQRFSEEGLEAMRQALRDNRMQIFRVPGLTRVVLAIQLDPSGCPTALGQTARPEHHGGQHWVLQQQMATREYAF